MQMQLMSEMMSVLSEVAYTIKQGASQATGDTVSKLELAADDNGKDMASVAQATAVSRCQWTPGLLRNQKMQQIRQALVELNRS